MHCEVQASSVAGPHGDCRGFSMHHMRSRREANASRTGSRQPDILCCKRMRVPASNQLNCSSRIHMDKVLKQVYFQSQPEHVTYLQFRRSQAAQVRWPVVNLLLDNSRIDLLMLALPCLAQWSLHLHAAVRDLPPSQLPTTACTFEFPPRGLPGSAIVS